MPPLSRRPSMSALPCVNECRHLRFEKCTAILDIVQRLRGNVPKFPLLKTVGVLRRATLEKLNAILSVKAVVMEGSH